MKSTLVLVLDPVEQAQCGCAGGGEAGKVALVPQQLNGREGLNHPSPDSVGCKACTKLLQMGVLGEAVVGLLGKSQQLVVAVSLLKTVA